MEVVEKIVYQVETKLLGSCVIHSSSHIRLKNNFLE